MEWVARQWRRGEEGAGDLVVCGGGDLLRWWGSAESDRFSASFPVLATRWSCRAPCSRAGVRGRRLRLLKVWKMQVMRSSSKTLATMQGGGPSGSRFVDFPSAMGLRPIQGCRGGAAAARQRHVFFDAVVFVILKDLFVIFLSFEDCSVRVLD